MNTKDKDKIKNIETKYKSVDNKMLDINSQLTDLIEFMGQSKETLFENLKQLEKEALLESAINFNLKEKNCSDDLNFIDMKFDGMIIKLVWFSPLESQIYHYTQPHRAPIVFGTVTSYSISSCNKIS